MHYLKTPPSIDRDRIVEMCQIPEARIWNIYMYGSRVYGNYSESSDYDFLVVANSIHYHKEWNHGVYNVHTITPDRFKDKLNAMEMHALECKYAPSFAIIQERSPEWNFELDKTKLQRKALTESYSAFHNGKIKILAGDMQRGMKSVWHSLRILIFADQLLREGIIYDFSGANRYWDEIEGSDFVRWNDFRDLVLPKKKVLEESVREASLAETVNETQLTKTAHFDDMETSIDHNVKL